MTGANNRSAPLVRGLVAVLFGALFSLAIAPGSAWADPWLTPGNVQLRQDIELLVDTDVINTPVTTWPIPWGSVAAELAGVDSTRLSPAQQLAYRRLLVRVRAVQTGGSHIGYKLAAAPGRPALRWFKHTPRGKEAVGGSFAGYNGNLAFRFDVTAVYGDRDHQRVRFDGSYLSVALGNWILTAGQIPQYWGPAWSGSLILGGNARPVPGISLSRNSAEPFDTPVLSWLGPWTFTTFIGRLDGNRYISHPYLIGMRFVFRPLSGVEIGLSRVMQFGGGGRRQDWSCFWDAMLGRTNPPGDSNRYDCASQMAAIDARFHIPETRLTFYGQMGARDTSHLGLTKWTDLLGLSMWGDIGNNGANYRAFIEYANTTVNSYKEPEPNIEYENYIYQSGYRYRGFSLGYPTDNDSELWTLGLTLQGSDNGQLTFIFRHGSLNRDNTNGNEPWGGNTLAPDRTALDGLDVYFRPSFLGGHISVGAGITRWAPVDLPAQTGLHAQIIWQKGFN